MNRRVTHRKLLVTTVASVAVVMLVVLGVFIYQTVTAPQPDPPPELSPGQTTATPIAGAPVLTLTNWQQVANFPGEPSPNPITAWADGRFFVFGGTWDEAELDDADDWPEDDDDFVEEGEDAPEEHTDEPEVLTGSAAVFDPAAGAWTPIEVPDQANIVWVSDVDFLQAEEWLCFLAPSDETDLTTYCYDAVAGTWTTLPNPGGDIDDHLVAAGNTLLWLGDIGNEEDDPKAADKLFDRDSGKWVKLATDPGRKAPSKQNLFEREATCSDGKIVVLDIYSNLKRGEDRYADDAKTTQAVTVYDIAKKKWKTLAKQDKQYMVHTDGWGTLNGIFTADDGILYHLDGDKFAAAPANEAWPLVPDEMPYMWPNTGEHGLEGIFDLEAGKFALADPVTGDIIDGGLEFEASSYTAGDKSMLSCFRIYEAEDADRLTSECFLFPYA
ncbi:MAG: hypothetical protein LBR58_07840 [Propionibacteriaceae bacterium]|jgi:hypothetical protein|nr:hypothetical protein [Propionibacteriaceae bacterium]